MSLIFLTLGYLFSSYKVITRNPYNSNKNQYTGCMLWLLNLHLLHIVQFKMDDFAGMLIQEALGHILGCMAWRVCSSTLIKTHSLANSFATFTCLAYHKLSTAGPIMLSWWRWNEASDACAKPRQRQRMLSSSSDYQREEWQRRTEDCWVLPTNAEDDHHTVCAAAQCHLQKNGSSLDKMFNSYGFFTSILATRCTIQIIDAGKVNNNFQSFDGIKFIWGHWQWFLWEEIGLKTVERKKSEKTNSARRTLWMNRRHFKGLLKPLRCQLMPFLAWFIFSGVCSYNAKNLYNYWYVIHRKIVKYTVGTAA